MKSFTLKKKTNEKNFTLANLIEKTPKSEIIKNFSLSLKGCAIDVLKVLMGTGLFGRNLNKFKKSGHAYGVSTKRKEAMQQ